jgi:hypothetical protein
MEKTILLASFIFPERVNWFFSYLETRFSIPKSKVFGYQNIDDESKIIMTFRISYQEDKPLNLKDLFPSAFPIHKKGDALYTINALNKLIDQMDETSIGNTDYKSVKINWNDYQNKLIVINGKELTFLTIKRIF